MRTVKTFKERWEQVEKENLKQDILRRIKNIQFDKEYREQHEALDHQALDKQIEEELQPKEGDEPIDEATKEFMARKLRFQISSKGFYAPHHARHKS